MPILYIFAESHTIRKNVVYNMRALVNISVQLTPNGTLTHIKIGDVNGIIENILANSPFGDWNTTD